MKYLLAAILLLAGFQPAIAKPAGISRTLLITPWHTSGASSLTCRMLEDEYAEYRRQASNSLGAMQSMYLSLGGVFSANLDDDWLQPKIDYAARALSDDIHDIPMMFTSIGKPYMTDYFATVLKELDHRQRKLCGYTIR